MIRIAPFLAIALTQLFAMSVVSADVSALGYWEFDTDRREVYIDSVKASQIDTTSMSEIAAQMGMAKIQNSIYEFGFDKEGPYLEIKDKASNRWEMIRLKVEVVDGKLAMKKLESGDRLRMEPIDNDHMTLIDEGKKLKIPLRRI
tara:strand:- start:2737 stop:3171 length:435 start_codon:yes stop_codon:yes gene_type:complete